MNITDPKIVALRANVKAAQQEFDLAVTFHETWKPTAYDHDRIDAWATRTPPTLST